VYVWWFKGSKRKAANIEPLTHLTPLVYLRLALPALTDIKGLDALKNLVELALSSNDTLTNIE